MQKLDKKFPLVILVFFFGLASFLGSSFLIKSKAIEIVLTPAQVTETISAKPDPIKNKSVSLILVGDIMLSRRVDLMMKAYNDYKFPFLKIADEFKKADIIFGNLENPISDKGKKVGSIYSFRADPRVIDGLTYAGFNVLSFANNHAFDYGRQAFEDTLLRLKGAGISYAGAGFNEIEAHSPAIKEANGVKIGFLAYTDLGSVYWTATKGSSGLALIDLKDFKQLWQDIEKARPQVDVLIVSLHSGEEYISEPSQSQIEFARTAIDYGADLLVGHHPHVVQKNEIYSSTGSPQAKYIFYSLGNFVFDQSFSEETMKGQIVKILIENGKIKKVAPQDIKINNLFQPELP
ncbi:MAG: CapA family protein [Candidatus Wildermuthbacteria bacterium]|nr:CapA family protein [Candidatus Wildermuthbacteria bacterium]